MQETEQPQLSPPQTAERAEGFWSGIGAMFKSRISWRIALTAFATMVFVQAAALAIVVHKIESERLDALRSSAREVVTVVVSDENGSDVIRQSEELRLSRMLVLGLAVYDRKLTLVDTYGKPPQLKPEPGKKIDDRRKIRGAPDLEVLFTPDEINRPYYVAARLYTALATPILEEEIARAVLALLGLAAIVTFVLMLALGRWLLQPIMVLRGNLLSAARSPEKPDIRRLPKETRDEVGIALRIANDLIRQNAHNLKRLRTQAEDKIHRLAYYDALTGLPNRTFFIEKLDEAIKRKVVEEDRTLNVFSIDIDHFKDINDTMGHEFGDKLLEAVSKRLVKALPQDALISRASADEFTVMAVMRPDAPDDAALIDRIFSAVAEPVSIMHERFQVRVSIGVAHCPDDGMDARQLLKNADIALNRAKEEGRDTVRYYSEDFDAAVQHRFQMLRDLRVAIDENQLQLFYQPQFDLASGRIIGAEALLRWWRPDNSKAGGSFVPPLDFIPLAEESGLIVPIGEWVVRTACAANKSWQEQGIAPFRIAVNVSGVHFHRADLVGLVEDVLRETKLAPKYLELEVTESVFMENTQGAIDIMQQLHRLGVELAIDDFGTGYSSLSYLRQFPIDRLKIDKSFIKNALTNPDDRMIARTIINLGHSLNLRVMAEGVETAEHESFLRADGCDEVQGYKYSKPVPAADFIDFVTRHNRALAQSGGLSLVDRAEK